MVGDAVVVGDGWDAGGGTVVGVWGLWGWGMQVVVGDWRGG